MLEDTAEFLSKCFERRLNQVQAELLGATTTSTTASRALTLADINAAMDRIRSFRLPPPPKIVSSLAMVEQYRFPRSKGKRIRAKWRKDSRNWRPSRSMMHDRVNNIFYAHPTIVNEIRKQTAEPARDGLRGPLGFA